MHKQHPAKNIQEIKSDSQSEETTSLLLTRYCDKHKGTQVRLKNTGLGACSRKEKRNERYSEIDFFIEQ